MRLGRCSYAIAALLAGCLAKSQTDCDDGTVCPANTQCVVGVGCATPEQIAACTGSDGTPLMPGAACMFGREVGTCMGQVCVGSLCGNGTVDPGEMCDTKDPRPDAPLCRADCLKAGEHCGDGESDTYAGEQCDNGASNGTPNDPCSATCQDRRCGNGLPDPGEVCDDGNNKAGDGCSADCKSDETCGNSIVDAAKHEQCDDGNHVAGDGCSAICQLEICGNHIVDPGEACDDGNTVSGDGCSADCKSDENCGNGTRDVAAGEECDDGNLLSHDGCDSHCRFETATWTQLGLAAPQSFAEPAMAYDAAHGTTVLFGGFGNNNDRDNHTYLWDGNAWTELSVAPAPDARHGHAMAYDAGRKRVVLFGGEDPMIGNQIVDDTWEWDGASWTQIFTANTPTVVGQSSNGLSEFAMAYDAAHHQIVLFGGLGIDSQTVGGDTWVYDGNDWTLLAPATSPPPRRNHVMSYDPARGRVVLFGGNDFLGGHSFTDTWEWDGTSWTQRFPATSPPFGAAMTYDAVRARTVLWGNPNQTWEWDGTDWSPQPGASPATLLEPAMVYDAVRGEPVLFGGFHISSFPPQTFIQTWTRDGTTWNLHAQNAPAARLGHAMTYDPRRSTIVQFGGFGPPVLGDTWVWIGTSWVQSTVAAPPARFEHAMSYDPVRDRIVLFGGEGTVDAPPLGDTWEWDGAAWTQPPASASPPPRRMHAMGYDAVGAQTLLVAGETTGAFFEVDWSRTNDTWGWNGTSWTQQAADLSPQLGATMVFDPQASTSLFGGDTNVTSQTLAWSFGPPPRWLDQPSALAMPPREWAAAAYDPVRRRTVAFGGFAASGAGAPLGDTWELDGTSWSRLNIGGPPPRSLHAMAYDATHQRILMSGGTAKFEIDFPPGPLGDTWTFQLRSPLPDEACTTGIDGDGDGRIGCDDPDCWGYCTPLCPPGSTSCSGPQCGDGVCSTLESCRLCPTDCGTCASACGDFVCDPSETAAICPGDCS